MMPFQLKEANRYYWIVKGQLIPESWSETDVMKIYESYFRRIWGNHEAGVHTEGFEGAWEAREAKNLLTTSQRIKL